MEQYSEEVATQKYPTHLQQYLREVTKHVKNISSDGYRGTYDLALETFERIELTASLHFQKKASAAGYTEQQAAQLGLDSAYMILACLFAQLTSARDKNNTLEMTTLKGNNIDSIGISLPAQLIPLIHHYGDVHTQIGVIAMRPGSNWKIASILHKTLRKSILMQKNAKDLFRLTSLNEDEQQHIISIYAQAMNRRRYFHIFTQCQQGQDHKIGFIADRYYQWIDRLDRSVALDYPALPTVEGIIKGVDYLIHNRGWAQNAAAVTHDQAIHELTGQVFGGHMYRAVVYQQFILFARAFALPPGQVEIHRDTLLTHLNGMTVRMTFRQAIDVFQQSVNTFNSDRVEKLQSVCNTDFEKFRPTQSGSVAMMSQIESMTGEMTIMRNFVGATQTEKMFGHMLRPSTRLTLQPRVIKFTKSVDELRAEVYRQFGKT